MSKKEFAMLIGIMLCVYGVADSSYNLGRIVESERWSSTTHNAAATGDKIEVDGIEYSVIVMPEPDKLQAYRSEYARHCQAVTRRFFEGMDNATNK